MLDAILANQLLKAIAPGTHLLLVGDPDQLPSVGAGDVLADLLRAELFPVTRLTQIFRQGAGSGIAANAQRINAGQLPRFGGEIGDCFFLPAEDPTEAARLVVDLVAQRLPARYGFRVGEVQVLSPMHRGEAGVGALNTRLQERLNPGTRRCARGAGRRAGLSTGGPGAAAQERLHAGGLQWRSGHSASRGADRAGAAAGPRRWPGDPVSRLPACIS